ncbi:hypothetical protein QYM36_009877 [Artemia franciscana]|uniref:Uncharacterized protein n=1 Tax=Artemia franciscana TaxID=6661 RepID=A0AA88HPU7_ARTSF|nr:hypothetical protein QYM36_009877 [Artemia franciscana]
MTSSTVPARDIENKDTGTFQVPHKRMANFENGKDMPAIGKEIESSDDDQLMNTQMEDLKTNFNELFTAPTDRNQAESVTPILKENIELAVTYSIPPDKAGTLSTTLLKSTPNSVTDKTSIFVPRNLTEEKQIYHSNLEKRVDKLEKGITEILELNFNISHMIEQKLEAIMQMRQKYSNSSRT